MALALDATDSTRQAMPGLGVITLRANCGRRTALRAPDALQLRGLIKSVRHAAPGLRAIYEIPPMPESGDTPLTPESGDTMLTPDLGNRVSPTNKRVSKSRRSGDTSLSPTKPTTESSTEPTARPTAQTIVAAFIDWDRDRGGRLTKRTIGQLATHIAGLLGEGIAEEHIKRGLVEWRDRGQNPSTLHSFVDAAMRPAAAPVSRRQAEIDARHERWMERARAADAGLPVERPW
jgi:hypothetical protein